MSAEIDFKNHIFTRLKSRIEKISDADAKQIYAFSLLINDQADSPWPVIELSFNTLKQWKKKIEHASDENEAKWNFAFWTQSNILVIADADDPEGFLLLENWLHEKNWYFTSEEYYEDFDRANDLLEEMIPALWRLVAAAVSRLHSEGVIKVKFGQPIPFIIHNLEYYDLNIECAELANPGIPLEGFKKFVNGD
jgi:hypothetical protein